MARKVEDRVVYDEETLRMGIRLYENCEIPLEIVYNLLKSKRLKSFSAIIVECGIKGFGEFLREQKRKTDFLVPLDESRNAYALICQETQVDGGYYFIKRLNDQLEKEDHCESISAAIVGIESARYPIRDLIFLVLDTYLKTLNDPENSISFRTVR